MPRSVKEWRGRTDDSPIPDRVKVRIFERDQGRCVYCTRKVGVGGEAYEFDHRPALINGGEHRESKIFLACKECHSKQTRQDVVEKATTYRKKKKHRLGAQTAKKLSRWQRVKGFVPRPPRQLDQE